MATPLAVEPEAPETLFEQVGAACIITLSRPRQLNALTHGMVRAILPRLLEWRDDSTVSRIIIKGAGGKAFCAGGDIRALYDLGKAGRVAEARPFWREEYILNYLLKTYPKPIIALLDGIVMGGGVGMSFHGSHRVATEKLMFAMPEVGIGFFPDVGASHFLPRLESRFGSYLALTGARIGQGDALALGLVTHAVESARMADIEAALCEGTDVNSALALFAVPAPPAPLLEHRAMIAEIFSEPDLATVMAKVSQMAFGGALFATQTLETMEKKSPTSMAIALEQMRRGETMTFAQAMQMEYRIVCRLADGHDFYEGVRAVIVDKDHAPKWKPARVESLDTASIARHFAPLPDDLALPDEPLLG